MTLCEGWIGEERASFVCAIGRCDVAAACVGRKIEHVSVSPAGEYDCIRCVPLHFSRAQVPSDDSLGLATDDHQVEPLGVWQHSHGAGAGLPAERLITASQELLARLAARVKSP